MNFKKKLKPSAGIEPATFALQVRCSKPLSYDGATAKCDGHIFSSHRDSNPGCEIQSLKS